MRRLLWVVLIVLVAVGPRQVLVADQLFDSLTAYDPLTWRGIDRRAVAAAVFHGTVEPAEGPPPGVTLDYDADATQEAVARAVQASLAGVGITVALRPTPPAAYDQLITSGAQEVFRLGWVAAYPSPEAVLSPLFGSASSSNLTGYADAAVDGLLQSARAEADPARRTAMYQQAERAIMDDVPVVPLAQIHLQAVVSRRVRGLVATSLGTFDAAAVTLAGRP